MKILATLEAEFDIYTKPNIEKPRLRVLSFHP
jgi:hypothetical protein